MAERPDFRELQYRFTAHLRDPAHQPAPAGIEERRLAVYRELLYNNTRSFIDSGFPVLRAVYAAQGRSGDWDRLTRDFFARHRARTPYFLAIGREFLDYLQHEHTPQADDPPFLRELAHYEWVELALSVSDAETDLTGIDAQGDLASGIPVLSPLAWPLTYVWPVQRIGPAHIPAEAPDSPTQLLVYRDAEDLVHFVELNAVSARLLSLVGENSGEGNAAVSGRGLLEQIADELGHPKPETVIQGGLALLEDLRDRGALLGTRAD
ncbi:MAG: putative DNA-binding domain-containing protein [Gammaproteobacteria bacterium]|nr:putative DNA-binding domain-containing protein [Gammaproteobacteria bacterium]MDX5374862.1 putative DNA-binding domain-containing protein [Gammaproteobacteria bacterium]